MSANLHFTHYLNSRVLALFFYVLRKPEITDCSNLEIRPAYMEMHKRTFSASHKIGKNFFFTCLIQNLRYNLHIDVQADRKKMVVSTLDPNGVMGGLWRHLRWRIFHTNGKAFPVIMGTLLSRTPRHDNGQPAIANTSLFRQPRKRCLM